MSELVLVTELEFAKGEGVFRAEKGLSVRPAPGGEAELAADVRKARCRAVIVGIAPYVGPLYEALGAVGGGQGAILARFGVGHDTIDKAQARRHGIVVTNTPGALDESVAELTVGLLLALARRIPQARAAMVQGRFPGPVGGELAGKTLAVIGFGAIGRRVAAMAAFGLHMKVLAVGRAQPDELQRRLGQPIDAICRQFGLAGYGTDVDAALRAADVVSLHLPANEQTRGFLSARRLAAMKPGAMLLNTARGSLVDESALYDALAGGRLGGAALDVYQTEPYAPAAAGEDLRKLDNVVLTPHVGSNTVEANARMAAAAMDNCRHFLAARMDRLTPVS